MSGNEKNVPKRRFKEFQNAEGWEQRKFSELFTTLQNNALSRAELNFEQGVARNVHYGDVLIKFGELLDVSKEEIPFIIDNTCVSKYKSSFLRNGDVIIADAAEDETVGKCSEIVGLTTQTVISGLHTIPCRPVKAFASGYLGFYMNSNAYHDQLLPLIQGTKVSSISKSALNDTVIISPKSIEEQTLMAKYFTSLDNLITIHQRKLEKIKALKKAYLTEMFPAEGARKPKRRFAGFTDDWKLCKIKQVCSISTGKSNTQDRIDDGIYPFYVRSPIIEHSNRYLYDEEAVLTVGDGVGTGKVFHYVNGKYDLHQRVYRMFDFINGTSGKYFYYYFSNHFYDRVMSMTAKTSVDSVRLEMISEMDIMLPTEKEQVVIADFFDNLNNLITLHQRKLEKLQNIKKAYLNEMFI
ncbi:restriction endonuclease subunit S [Clostridium saccharobutylicum]|uniref:EcoKI restriction-modification system protein HsdS n=1 Tax=Clostridium saccharobutylicum TaxID=169679 RepID=A0A1S8MNF6_CLOSA|nr:restriction endonuclease subunit S [Clostridium saccharobutylicum]OOM05698.1 EcoKI restriction-modification system protein HsdS [Clostridium saccharobutylicum]